LRRKSINNLKKYYLYILFKLNLFTIIYACIPGIEMQTEWKNNICGLT